MDDDDGAVFSSNWGFIDITFTPWASEVSYSYYYYFFFYYNYYYCYNYYCHHYRWMKR